MLELERQPQLSHHHVSHNIPETDVYVPTLQSFQATQLACGMLLYDSTIY